MNFSINGVEMIAFIFGIVEAAKAFGINGRGSQVLALALGFLFTGVAQAISNSIIPANIVVYIELIVMSVAGALATMGYYDFLKKKILRL